MTRVLSLFLLVFGVDLALADDCRNSVEATSVELYGHELKDQQIAEVYARQISKSFFENFRGSDGKTVSKDELQKRLRNLKWGAESSQNSSADASFKQDVEKNLSETVNTSPEHFAKRLAEKNAKDKKTSKLKYAELVKANLTLEPTPKLVLSFPSGTFFGKKPWIREATVDPLPYLKDESLPDGEQTFALYCGVEKGKKNCLTPEDALKALVKAKRAKCLATVEELQVEEPAQAVDKLLKKGPYPYGPAIARLHQIKSQNEEKRAEELLQKAPKVSKGK